MNEKLVALKYPEGAPAPFITAISSGNQTKRLLEIARENGIPVVENEGLADFLSVQEIGQCVPEETWDAVAKIFAFVIDLE